MPTMTHRAAPEPATDAELAHSIAAGDQKAFVLLMRRHNQLLFRTARSIPRDDRDAEDAVQDAYLAAGSRPGLRKRVLVRRRTLRPHRRRRDRAHCVTTGRLTHSHR